jgi:hypothetical protein
MARPLPKNLIQKIKNEILNGKSKYQVAIELGLHPSTVYRVTGKISGKSFGWHGIRGKSLKILQEILTNGYAFTEGDYAGCNYPLLKKYFPKIRRVHILNKSVLFLEDKAENVARAYLKHLDKKFMSYQELKQITKVFGVELDKQEKQAFLGKTVQSFRRKKQRRNNFHLSFCKESQSKIDDFFGRFLHSEVLRLIII